MRHMSTPIASSDCRESRLDIYLRRVAYAALGGLVLFDALNFFQFLPYKVEFTLFGPMRFQARRDPGVF
jgi:hypothetical protein